MPPDIAAALAAATHLWIETGNMYGNLGGGRSNQLDMKAGTRTFFGFSNRCLEPETQIGTIQLGYGGDAGEARNLWFGDNSMDKLHLVPPGTSGAADTYVGRVLLFEKRRDGAFAFRVGASKEVKKWMKLSESRETAFSLRSGRRYGVFS